MLAVRDQLVNSQVGFVCTHVCVITCICHMYFVGGLASEQILILRDQLA